MSRLRLGRGQAASGFHSNITQFHRRRQTCHRIARWDEFLTDIPGVLQIEQFPHDRRIVDLLRVAQTTVEQTAEQQLVQASLLLQFYQGSRIAQQPARGQLPACA